VSETVQDELRIGATAPAAGRRRHHEHRVHTPRGRFELRLGHMWLYRRTISYFGWTYIRSRFQGMWLGWLWLPLPPALQILSRGFVFGGMLHLGSGDRPYIIFLVVGQAAWDLFDKTVYRSFRGLRAHRRVLEAMPVPYVNAVASTAVYAAFDALTYVGIGAAAAVYYKVTQGSFYIGISSPAQAVKLMIGIALIAAWGIALAAIFAPLIVAVRDLRFALRYLLSFWFFLTPVLYATSSLPPQYRGLATYNPITAPIELVKDAVLGTGPPQTISVVVSVAALLVVMPLGLLTCNYFERKGHAGL